MRNPRRKRWGVALLALALLLAAALAASERWALTWYSPLRHSGTSSVGNWFAALARGELHAGYRSTAGSPNRWIPTPGVATDIISFGRWSDRTLIPKRISANLTRGWTIPLHIPNLVLIAAAVWLLRPGPPPGHCTKCGYDLRGLTPGPCPECGSR
jgi:hypothetical protein